MAVYFEKLVRQNFRNGVMRLSPRALQFFNRLNFLLFKFFRANSLFFIYPFF